MSAAAANVVHIGPNQGPQSAAFASNADITVYGGAAGGGKALALDTPIATPAGWTTMGELRDGDIVFAPDGTQTLVSWCSDVQHGRDCYDVTFSDGAVITADREHLWWTFTYAERSAAKKRTPEARAARRAARPSRSKGTRPNAAAILSARNSSRTYDLKPAPGGGMRTTEEIAASLIARKTHRNHSVPVTRPIQCEPATLPIPPYVLGLWLGDGTCRTGVISKPDLEIDAQIEECGFSVRRLPSNPISIRVLGLTAALKEQGLLGDKHIPPAYLRASFDQRLALAQGLLDTDGHASPVDGSVEWTTTTRALAKDMLELLHTLGCKATLGEGRATLEGRDCGPKWRITVLSDLPLFRLTRKLQAQKRDAFRGTHDQRYIVSVTPRASEPVRCIRVNHPSHCFLAGRDLIPTHNTHLALLRMGVHAHRHKGYYGAIFRREMPMITVGGGLWEESMKLYPAFSARPNIANHEWRFADRSMIQLRSLQHDKDVLNYQGAQFAEFCLEEGTHFKESMFWYLLSRLRTTCGLRARCMITCNPDPDSWLRTLIDWYIGDDGYPIADRGGVKRYFVRDGNDLVWGGSADEVRQLAPHITCDPHNQPKTLRFIPAVLSDNPKGDPTYESRLNALPLVERMQLRGGNWNIRAAAGTVFRRAWFELLDYPPQDIANVGRFWDLAATEPSSTNKDPDWTRGVKLGRTRSGMFVVLDVASARVRPHDVDALLDRTAQQDGRGCMIGFWQDPGSAGKSEAQRHLRRLAGYNVSITVAALNKVAYAKAASSQAEGGNLKIVRAPWNDAYLSEHEAFPDGGHDDIVDAESLGMLKLTTTADVKYINIPGL